MNNVENDTNGRIGVRELRDNLSSFLRQAQQGKTLLIMSHGKVVAELGPASRLEPPKRQPGTLRGKIHMAPDFDDLPDDVLAALEE